MMVMLMELKVRGRFTNVGCNIVTAYYLTTKTNMITNLGAFRFSRHMTEQRLIKATWT